MTGFSSEVRDLVRARASDWCGGIMCEVMVRCQGRAVALYDLHHRRNRGAGGSRRPETNEAANALAACRDCHSFIGAQPRVAYDNGWLVKQHHLPAEIPVRRRGVWVYLDDSGGVTPAQCICGETSPDWWPCKCLEDGVHAHS